MDNLEKLKAKFEKASEENQRAYDAWNNEDAPDNVKATYERAIRKGDKKTAEEFKERYQKLASAYKATQEEKNRLKKELNKAEKSATQAKESKAKLKGAEGTYKKALDELAIAETNLGGYQGEENYNKAYLAAQEAFKTITEGGKTPKQPLPIAKIAIKQPEPKAEKQKTPEQEAQEQQASWSQILNTLADPAQTDQLISVQQDLRNKWGYKGPADGRWSKKFQDALQAVFIQRGSIPKVLQGTDFRTFLANPGIDVSTSTGGTTPTTSISPKADATVYINNAFTRAGIGRKATEDEVNALTKVLNDAENRFRTTRSGGVTKDRLGDRTQFITNLITTGKYVDPNTGKAIKGLATDVKVAAQVIKGLTKTAEVAKADTRSLTSQALQAVASANGISLTPDQLNQYAMEVQNGKDVNVIKSQIRSLAGLGMPDNIKKLLGEGTDLATIYSPYKQAMASALELNPNSISLSDPTLRTAITPGGEMSLYDFQKALRQDNRWQYTNNAREEVSNSIMQVLKDFGFRG